jgi:hypothetical protein
MKFDGPLGDLWRPLECRTYGAYIIWTCADNNITECAESKECHPAKHHYDECVERVTGQIENDGKASEDCVEECTSSHIPTLRQLLTHISLPPGSLRIPMRRTKALCPAQVDTST